MLSAISLAQTNIYLEMYAFQTDTAGYDFLSILEKKARQGVKIVLILDSLGSFGLSSASVRSLREAGAEVLFFSYWFRRLHRKILIIDERIAFLGGVNISGAFAPWKDMQVRITGRRILAVSLRSFSHVYKECGGKNPELLLRYDKKPLFRKAKAWYAEHGIGGKWLEIKKQYESHIETAKEKIILVTPYFFPRRWMVARLHEAILRGVRVEIIIPQNTDHGRIMNRINYFQLSSFIKLGAVGYLSHEMNHAKILLIDDSVGMVGSGNLDPISFGWNAEAGVFFTRPVMIRDLRKILEEWKAEASFFTPEMFISRWSDILLVFFRWWF